MPCSVVFQLFNFLFRRRCVEIVAAGIHDHGASACARATIAIPMQAIPDPQERAVVEIQPAADFLHVDFVKLAEPEGAKLVRTLISNDPAEAYLLGLELFERCVETLCRLLNEFTIVGIHLLTSGAAMRRTLRMP
ncbi:MAG: hypothetical protein WA156_19310 [Methylocystis silviterrae]